MIKRATKVSNIIGEVNFKEKQRLSIVFTGNTLPHRKQSGKGAEDFIVDIITCLQHTTLPKLNSQTMSLKSHKQ